MPWQLHPTEPDTWQVFAAGTGQFLASPHVAMSDPVNHPPHYTYGPVEAIDVIEAAIAGCPDPVAAHLHGTALKYLLRLHHKGHAAQDAGKAAWYLQRLVDRLRAEPWPFPPSTSTTTATAPARGVQ